MKIKYLNYMMVLGNREMLEYKIIFLCSSKFFFAHFLFLASSVFSFITNYISFIFRQNSLYMKTNFNLHPNIFDFNKISLKDIWIYRQIVSRWSTTSSKLFHFYFYSFVSCIIFLFANIFFCFIFFFRFYIQIK